MLCGTSVLPHRGAMAKIITLETGSLFETDAQFAAAIDATSALSPAKCRDDAPTPALPSRSRSCVPRQSQCQYDPRHRERHPAANSSKTFCSQSPSPARTSPAEDRSLTGQPGFAVPGTQQAAIDALAPGEGRDIHIRFRAFGKNTRLLFVGTIPPLPLTGVHFDPAILSLMHGYKHGTSAISNHPNPLLSMTALISPPGSQKERSAVRRAHALISREAPCAVKIINLIAVFKCGLARPQKPPMTTRLRRLAIWPKVD